MLDSIGRRGNFFRVMTVINCNNNVIYIVFILFFYAKICASGKRSIWKFRYKITGMKYMIPLLFLKILFSN